MYISAGNLTDHAKVTPLPNVWGVGTMRIALYTPLEWGLPPCDLQELCGPWGQFVVSGGHEQLETSNGWKQDWKEDWQGRQT